MRCPTKLQTISTKKQHSATNFRRAAKKIMRLKRVSGSHVRSLCKLNLTTVLNRFGGDVWWWIEVIAAKNAAKFAVFIDVSCRNTCFCGII